MKKLVSILAAAMMITGAFASCGSSSDSSDSETKAAETAASTEAGTEEVTEAETEADTEEKTEKATEKATEKETEAVTEAETEAETEDKSAALNSKAKDIRNAAMSASMDLDAAGTSWINEGKGALVSSDGCDGLTNEQAFMKKFKEYVDTTGYEYVITFSDSTTVKNVWVAESWDSKEIGKYPESELNTDGDKTLKEILDFHS